MHLWNGLGEVAVWDDREQDARDFFFKPVCPVKGLKVIIIAAILLCAV